MKTIKFLPIILILIITSCASVNVNTDYDKSTTFSDYKTYAYYKQGIDKAKISDFDKRRILNAIDSVMTSKNFTKSETPDMMINFYYSVMSIYGWILWSKSSEDHVHVEVSWATKKEWIFSGILFFLSLFLVTLVYYYKPFIDNHFSMTNVKLGLYHLDWANWLDVFTTAIFLVGMWLMAKRKIENWIFWIVGDLIVVPMMIYKGLGITSIQYFVFTGMAIVGYLEWRKSLKPITSTDLID